MAVPFAVLALACHLAVACSALRWPSSYHKDLEVLSAVMKQDQLWKYVFAQKVYHEFDRTYYRKEIDNELLPGALAEAEGHGGVGVLVHPQRFLRNVFDKWYKVGSVLDAAMKVVRKAFKCLAYKHVSHMITLIQYEISRNSSQDKATSWSGKAKKAVSDVLRKMAALRVMDDLLLRTTNFLSTYTRHNTYVLKNKFTFTPFLTKLVDSMKEYMTVNCFQSSTNDREIAIELGVPYSNSLNDKARSKVIKKEAFKQLFKGSLDKVQQHFGLLPYGPGSMAMERWNEVLRLEPTPEEKGDAEVFQQIDRLRPLSRI